MSISKAHVHASGRNTWNCVLVFSLVVVFRKCHRGCLDFARLLLYDGECPFK